MKIKLTHCSLNIELLNNPANADRILFCLHGFTGSSDDWTEAANLFSPQLKVYAVDLIGHGKSDSPAGINLYTQHAIVQQLDELFSSFTNNKFYLMGYSFGGRAALSYAVSHNDKIAGLILESASAGIEDEQEREKRIQQDQQLADFILKHSLDEFADYWMNLDLFNTQRRFSNERLQLIRKAKLNNSKDGLSNSLIGFSTGVMLPLYDSLKKITVKTLLITGELDSKFTEINSEMVRFFPDAVHKIIKNAGHNTHIEEPKRFAEVVNEYFRLKIP